MTDSVKTHYACPDLIQKIRAGMNIMGKSPKDLTLRDLGPVDQLHTGGAPATLAMGKLAGLAKDASVLDAGCGLGGSSRLLAEKFNLKMVGIDLCQDFVNTAETLTQWCGLDQTCDICFFQGSVLDLPFETNHFDAILCQHILMNLEDKPKALAEFFRVVKPGGKLILHEITQGQGPAPLMPVPWASDPSISFVPDWENLLSQLENTGFVLNFFKDLTSQSAAWWKKVNAVKREKGQGPLNPGLVFGQNAALFGPNMETNFSKNAIRCIEAVLIKK
ncbi:MAG: methyltransferase domain-containing protein [Desulfobacter sp.]|nr:MAG: methyltransferase domain-containing protein [Desulfobacter sp.]